MPKPRPFDINVSAAVISLKPRQVLLSRLARATNLPTTELAAGSVPIMDRTDDAEQVTISRSRQQNMLVHIVARYLKQNGFSKTLKKFLSEAKLEADAYDDTPHDLEVLFADYLLVCNESKRGKRSDDTGCFLKESKQDDENGGSILREKHETVKANKASKVKDRNKNKKSAEVSNHDVHQLFQKLDKVSNEQSEIGSRDKEEAKSISKGNQDHKPKKGKKSRSCDEEVEVKQEMGKNLTDQQEASTPLVIDDEIREEEHSAVKKKGKKRKDHLKCNSNGNSDAVAVDAAIRTEEIVTDKKTKSMKKRQRESTLNDDTHVAGESGEAFKRRKSCNSKDIDFDKKSEVNSDGDQFGNNGNHHLSELVQVVSPSNNKGTNDDSQSAQVKRFQRVNAEEVVFSDDRLKDNSYWAKDGAEIGYGAKAQEVLGQVRGKGFRHEKTKKKRGSYRGGQIDQQSHSIKFNFSDDE